VNFAAPANVSNGASFFFPEAEWHSVQLLSKIVRIGPGLCFSGCSVSNDQNSLSGAPDSDHLTTVSRLACSSLESVSLFPGIGEVSFHGAQAHGFQAVGVGLARGMRGDIASVGIGEGSPEAPATE